MADAKPKSTRDALGDALLDAAQSKPNLVVIGADTSESLQTMRFGKAYPARFFNVGIAEQNMVGVAAGLALYGKTAVCGTYAVFLERAIDQIRNTVAYCDLDVKIIGAHAGLVTGPDGGSHQTIEDIAIMRAIPNMRVVAPCDYASAKALIAEAVSTRGPFYIRVVRPASPAVYPGGSSFRVGRAEVIRDGSDIALAANGVMVPEALKAADSLASRGISARVIDCHTIKPLDGATLLKAASETGGIVTAEDHNRFGGLGSAVAEIVAARGGGTVGIVADDDRFGESGDGTEVMAAHGLSAEAIVGEAARILGRKKR